MRRLLGRLTESRIQKPIIAFATDHFIIVPQLKLEDQAVQLIDHPKRHLGLHLSILLHAALIGVLVAMENIRQPDVKPPQFIEIATISLKQEIQDQASTLPAQTQRQLLHKLTSNKLKSKSASIPVPNKRQKTKKPIVKPNPSTVPETENSPVTNPLLDATMPTMALTPLSNGNSSASLANNSPTANKGTNDSGSRSGDGASGTVVSSKSLVVLSRILPRYPLIAESRGIEGWVRIEVIVATDGTVSRARVVDANPKHLFDQSALDAIRRWIFKPAFKDGHAVAQRATLNMLFKIKKQR